MTGSSAGATGLERSLSEAYDELRLQRDGLARERRGLARQRRARVVERQAAETFEARRSCNEDKFVGRTLFVVAVAEIIQQHQ